MRPIILGMALLSKRVAAAASKYSVVVSMNTTEIAEQVAPTRKRLLLDGVLDAARRQRVHRLLALRQFLAQPGHGAIEMMEPGMLDAVDACPRASARRHGPGGTTRRCSTVRNTARSTAGSNRRPASRSSTTAQQPLSCHNRSSSSGQGADARHASRRGVLDQRQDHRALRQSGGRARQASRSPAASAASLQQVRMMRCLVLPFSRTVSTKYR